MCAFLQSSYHPVKLPAEVPSFTSGRGITFRALKADDGSAPAWQRDTLLLQKLLNGAWAEVSSEWVKKLIAAFKANNQIAIEKLIKESKGLGKEMVKALEDTPEAAYSNIMMKAESFWKLHAEDIGIKEPATLSEKYRESMAEAQAKQVKAFAEKYPERILHPEIIGQLERLQETTTPDALLISSITDRLGRLETAQGYWDGLSDVQVGRIWNANGVIYANENGIKTGRITGPLDPLTCKVCRRFIGMPVDIETAMAKFGDDLEIQDPDAYVDAWPFPRLADVEGKDPDELAAEGWLPPYHPNG